MVSDNLEVKILERSENKLLLEVFFEMKNGYFDGHFPELPLLPGVIQTHLAIRLFEKYQERALPFGGFKLIKFFSPIFPNSRVTLSCELDPKKKQLSFQYSNRDKAFSKGVMVVKDV